MSQKVSVVIVCYNYGRFLDRAIESVLLQTHANTEIVVVDHASSDETPLICSEFHDKITYHLLWPNQGQPAPAKNQGVNLASGELIVCLDADDFLAPTMVEECVQALSDPKVSIAYPGTILFGSQTSFWPAAPYEFTTLLMNNFIPCASMFRKQAWRDVGGFALNTPGMDDWGFWIACGGRGHFGVPVNKPLFHHRMSADGMFERDVVPNHEKRFPQIVLNNAPLYPVAMVQAAIRGEPVIRQVS